MPVPKRRKAARKERIRRFLGTLSRKNRAKLIKTFQKVDVEKIQEEMAKRINENIAKLKEESKGFLLEKRGMVFKNEGAMNRAKRRFERSLIGFIDEKIKNAPPLERAKILQAMQEVLFEGGIVVVIPKSSDRIPTIAETYAELTADVVHEALISARKHVLKRFSELPKEQRYFFFLAPFTPKNVSIAIINFPETREATHKSLNYLKGAVKVKDGRLVFSSSLVEKAKETMKRVLLKWFHENYSDVPKEYRRKFCQTVVESVRKRELKLLKLPSQTKALMKTLFDLSPEQIKILDAYHAKIEGVMLDAAKALEKEARKKMQENV